MCALTHNKRITQSAGQKYCKTVQTGNVVHLLSEEPVLEGRFEGVLVCFVLFCLQVPRPGRNPRSIVAWMDTGNLVDGHQHNRLEKTLSNNQMGALTVLQRICKIGNRHLNILECSKKIRE